MYNSHVYMDVCIFVGMHIYTCIHICMQNVLSSNMSERKNTAVIIDM